MAIKKIVGPVGGQAPSSTADYIAQNNILTTLMIGLGKLPITEYDSANKPQIAEGVPIQFGGALYAMPSGEGNADIAGTPSNGETYIKLVPNGDASELSPAFTNTWDATYNYTYGGWYNSSNHLFLPYGMTVSGSSYSDKFQYAFSGNRDAKVGASGTLEITQKITSAIFAGAVVV